MGTVRIFNHYLRISFLVLGLIEVFIFLVSVYAGTYLRFDGNLGLATDLEQGLWPLQPRAFVFASVFVLCMTAMGLYQAQRREGTLNMLLRLSVSYLVGTTGLVLLFYLVPPLYLGRGIFGLAVSISLVATTLTRLVFLNTVDKDALKRRVLVYGAGPRAANINALRRRSDQQGFHIVGFIHVPGEQDVVDGGKVIHLHTSLLNFALEQKVEEIVVAINDRRCNFPLDDLLNCRLSGIDIIEPINFLERETGKVRIDLLQPSWMIFSDGFKRSAVQSYFERAFDIFSGSLLLIISWPILLLTVVAIWLESGGRHPVLYRQVRVGQNGNLFELLKFRSMRIDAEQDGIVQWASEDDERITRVGRVIRKFRIDELPQVFNILRGDMSLVGPRPERPEFVKDLSEKIPFYGERHRVKPGLAGWAQMKYPYASSVKDAIEKLQYDLYYVKNNSVFFDFYILLQTAEVVLWGKGAR